jgi:anti-sigma-K factor RskA
MEAGIHELTAAYALDALEPEKRRAFEAHLESCESCREELAAFASTTEALAVAASGPAPPPELRDRILATARAEPQVVVPFERRRSRSVPVLAAAAAVAAVLALAVGLWAMRLSDDLDEARSALEILQDPDARTVPLRTGTGRLVVDPDGRAVLVVGGLEPAPDGKTYEVWVVEGDTPVPAGLFAGGDAAEVVGVEGTVDDGDVVAVTVEDAGGAETPTLPLVVASAPV